MNYVEGFLYLVSGIRYPAESVHQLSGDIWYPVKIAIRYIPNLLREMGNVGDDVSSSGRAFHVWAAAT